MSNEPLALEHSVMTPREMVEALDRFIIGQTEAKRKVAIALRNRWRRMQLPEWLRPEVTPKNILMIGPTGVGKTEIARRIAKLVKAPLIKVEATKYTEVGYVGRDVESIIRDLADVAFKMERETAVRRVDQKAHEAAEERILDALLPAPKNTDNELQSTGEPSTYLQTRQKFRRMLREGELDDTDIELQLSAAHLGMEIMSPPGMEEMTGQLSAIFQILGEQKKRKRKLKVKEAFKHLKEEEAAKLLDQEDLKNRAIENVEQNGIVFIDEIDKIAERQDSGRSGGVSREGVQRDLLPLIEGCTVNTKYGQIKTDHILFIASGAFHLSKPSDLVPELQGRLPIRVELKPLSVEDFVKILTEPKASLVEQYIALLATEGVHLRFKSAAIRRMAEIAYHVNEKNENIGARRLHTVIEKLLEEISYAASDQKDAEVEVDVAYVNRALAALADDEDLSKYIL